MENGSDIVIFGAAILDIPAGPVDITLLWAGSVPADRITMNTGGDALNEATVLAKLGKPVRLVSKVGDDMAGRVILDHCRQYGIDTEHILVEPGLDTGVNVVLVHPDGERSFLTNRNGALRRIYREDLRGEVLKGARIFCFASIFVFPWIGKKELASIFKDAKAGGLILCADMTKCKNRETVQDLREALLYLDYLFPNLEEAQMVTGKTDPDEAADAFLECGVKTVVIKLGQKGCLIKSKDIRALVPAYSNAVCVDTTGAGDAFAAGFLYGLSEGMPPVECARFGNAAASAAIEEFGAVVGVRDLAQVYERYEKLVR